MIRAFSRIRKMFSNGQRVPFSKNRKRTQLMVEELEVREMLTVNAGPVAFSMPHDQTLQLSAGALLANSSTDSGNSLSAALVSCPADGTLSNLGADGSFSYTPGASYVGTDNFVFSVSDGIDSATATATISITDNPAQVQANNLNLAKYQDYNGIYATFTDTDTPYGPFTATVDFGDGQSAGATVVADPNGGYDVIADHTFNMGGNLTLGVTVTDPLGVFGTSTASVVVTTPPLQGTNTPTLTGIAGTPLSNVVASFTTTDPGALDYTASINWGDGATAPGTIELENGQYLVVGSHTYASSSDYQITTTVTLDNNTAYEFVNDAMVIPQNYTETSTDADGNVTQFIFNQNMQVVQQISPLGGSTFFTYNDQGLMASQTDALGRVIDYGYNNAGQLTSETWLAADGSVSSTESFVYDNSGNLVSASNDNGTYSFTYQNGQLVGVTEPYGVSLSFTYDASGNRASVADSFGGLLTSAYDANNQLQSRAFSDGVNTLDVTLTYNSDGTTATINRYSDLAGTQLVAATAFTYTQGQIASILHTDAQGNVIDGFNYQYSNGLVSSSSSAMGPTANYTYDRNAQLLSDGTNNYSYDANGNRTMTGYVVGPDNQLLSDGTWNYSYDAVGNLAGKVNIATGETWTYSYDNMNHMVGAQQFSGNGNLLMQAFYKYDVFGNRIETDVWSGATGMVVTRFAYDGWNKAIPTVVGNEMWNVWAVMNGSSQLITRYINGDAANQVFARIDSNGVAWLLTDALGSTRDVIDQHGVLLAHIDYDSYGNIIYQSNAALSGSILYTGDQFDAETGFYFSRARYLNPQTGIWTTKDPMGLAAGDPNLYRYVSNSPINATDPSGNIIWFLVIGGVAGAMLLYPPEVNPPPNRPPNPGNPVRGAIEGMLIALLLKTIGIQVLRFRVGFLQGQLQALQAQRAAAQAAGNQALVAQLNAEIQAIVNQMINLGLRIPPWLR